MMLMLGMLASLGGTPPQSPSLSFGQGGSADCVATGACPVPAPAGPPSGVMFIAAGLVLGGAAGLRRERRRPVIAHREA